LRSVPRKPVIGVLCCNEHSARPIQVVASRFIEPLATLSGATVLLVPALVDSFDARSIADRLDGLLLTGSRSNVAPHRYDADGDGIAESVVDEQRDEVALALAGHMIESGRPVFGICRGLQEINVLFGGSLIDLRGHHRGGEDVLPFDDLFDHRHDVDLVGTRLAGGPRISVNSVHHQGIGRLGSGLEVEAVSVEDQVIEAVSSRPCGADVIALQWHPEWNVDECATSTSFFERIGAALRWSSGIEADQETALSVARKA
jgi:putative glutamine amidotransferase